MFESNSKKIDAGKENITIEKHFNLNKDLDCFVLISSSDIGFSDVILNKILDSTVDKLSIGNTYNDFTSALENINSIIKTWKTDNSQEIKLDIIIAVLSKNNLIFSTIGKTSCYLIKENKEIAELTQKDESKEEFSFVYSGELNDSEIVVMGTRRLLNYLSDSDFTDQLDILEINEFNKNIENILKGEILEENIVIYSIKYSSSLHSPSLSEGKLDTLKQGAIKALDNKFTKNIFARIIFLKEQVYKQSKKVKNFIFVSGIIVSFILLYFIVSSVILVTNSSKEKEESKENLIKAQQLVRLASENVVNPEIFEQNIKKAEEIIFEVKNKKLFLNDIGKIIDDISIIKNQFNNIESFQENKDNIIYNGKFSTTVKVVKNNGKLYVVKQKSIIGPIISTKNSKEIIFDKLEKEEKFIDAQIVGDEIILLTNFSKIVSFSKNSYFTYKDVIGQKTWEESDEFSSYDRNIYLISKDRSRILKHSKSGDGFSNGINFLKKEDSETIGSISSIGIDGGIYVLKNDLSLIKVFLSPKYRVESIIINKLPKNYEIENPKNKIKIKVRNSLNYVYLLLNEKIWIFRPNSKRFQDTKNLTYIGQIEGENYKIRDFFVEYDGELIILNEKGLYRLSFEIDDDNLLVR